MLYQFKIKLRGITKPPVWRRLLVPSYFKFDTFHQVIQNAFGWYNEHLYHFAHFPYNREMYIALYSPDDWESPTYEADKYRLEEFFGKGDTRQKLCYVYDFGDDWIHDIVLEKVLPEVRMFASCISGKGACPVENCGGSWGYSELKANGEVYDPADFDVVKANEKVQKVRL